MNIHGLAMAVACSVFGIQVSAQDNPSYADTVRFMQEKGNIAYTVYDNRIEQSIVEIRRCEIGFYTTQRNYQVVRVVDMSTLDPSRVEVNLSNRERQVFFRTRNDRDVIPTFKASKIDPSSISVNGCNASGCEILGHNNNFGVGVIPRSENNAPRMRKAISHLIEICGGKEELF